MKCIIRGMFLSVILKYNKNLSVKLRDVYEITKFYICTQTFCISVLSIHQHITLDFSCFLKANFAFCNRDTYQVFYWVIIGTNCTIKRN